MLYKLKALALLRELMFLYSVILTYCIYNVPGVCNGYYVIIKLSSIDPSLKCLPKEK